MFITPSFKKSLIVEQFKGNYLKQFESVEQASHFMKKEGTEMNFGTSQHALDGKLILSELTVSLDLNEGKHSIY